MNPPPTPVEFLITPIDPAWSPETLLQQDAIFRLKDVERVLGIERRLVTYMRSGLKRDGKSPYLEMGLWIHSNRLLVQMKTFATFYESHAVLQLRSIPGHWNEAMLLRQTGVFTLGDVCRHISFNVHQLRYRYRYKVHGEETGIFRAKDAGQRYLVRMETFGPWIKSHQSSK